MEGIHAWDAWGAWDDWVGTISPGRAAEPLHGTGAWDGMMGTGSMGRETGGYGPLGRTPLAGTRGWWGVGFEGEGLCTKIARIEQKMA